ncbi:hypothetical protein F4677DRAFT_449649 [Hypoxylon crocopeplum]|nr:hypothetical protein F4677DRAFT_449649 [Hypoxylon crocopeplum]
MSMSSDDDVVTIIRRSNSFKDLPNDPDSFPARVIFLQQSMPSEIALSEGDAKIRDYEEYLRSKWPCSEAIPPPFDPDRLETVRQIWRQLQAENVDPAQTDIEVPLEEMYYLYGVSDEEQEQEQEQEHVSKYIYPETPNPSSESSAGGEQLEGYDNETAARMAPAVNITKAGESTTRTTRRPVERQPNPRIKTGSKPPLSRSAFARAGLPYLVESRTGHKRAFVTLTPLSLRELLYTGSE